MKQLLALADIKQRRLRAIEQIVARDGSRARPDYLRERDELRAEIARLEQQLRDAGVAPNDADAVQQQTSAPVQQVAPALGPEERAPLAAQYRMTERRLKIRERQQALLGLDTPPEFATEIEDLRKRLADLAGRLGGAPAAPAPRQLPDPASPEQRPLIEAQRELVAERLSALEAQRARYGEARVPPEIVIEIENLRDEIAGLDLLLSTAPDEQPSSQEAALGPETTGDQQQDQELQALISSATWVAGQAGEQNVAQSILDSALRITGSSTGTLHLYDQQHNELVLAAERSVSPEHAARRLHINEGIIGLSASQRTLLNVPDVTTQPWKLLPYP